MAKLSEMILGETGRTMDLADRPATLLRRQENARQQGLVLDDQLKTSAQDRLLRSRGDKRADRADKRAEKQEGREAERAPILNEQIKANTEALKNKNVKEAQQTAQTYVTPVVEQMVQFNKQYLESGDPKMKEQRDKLLKQFAENKSLKAYVGMTPQYSELSGLSVAHLYDPAVSDSDTEKEVQDLMSGLDMSGQVYKTLEQKRATEAAAYVLSQNQAQAAGKGKGETDALLDRTKRFDEAGIKLPEEPRSEGQMTNERQLFGKQMTNMLRDYGFSKDAMQEFGLSAEDYGNMDHQMFGYERTVMNEILPAINSGGKATVFGEEVDFSNHQEGIARVLKLAEGEPLDILAAESPNFRLLNWAKGESAGKIKRLKTKTSAHRVKQSLISE